MPTIVCDGVEVELLRESWEMPKTCPCCGTPVVRQEGFVAFKCTNKACKDQATQRLLHAVGKPALDWDGFGAAQADIFVAAGYTKLVDLFRVTAEQVAVLFKGSAARKFLKERERAKQQPLWRKLHALGIELVGATLCKELAAKFTSLEDICSHPVETAAILGDVRSKNFWEAIDQWADELEQLDQLGFRLAEDRVLGVLSGKTFCITGTLMTGSRDQVSERIEKAGGIVKGSVGKSTSYLVMGEAPGANKAANARKYNVPIINEEQLYGLMGIPMPTAAVSVEDHDY